MNVIFIGENIEDFSLFQAKVNDVSELDLVRNYISAPMAKNYVVDSSVDLIFLDIDMNASIVKALIHKFRQENADIYFVFFTKRQECPMNMIKQHPVAIISNDFSREELEDAAEIAYMLLKRKKKRIYVRTFGHFDVFVDHKAVMFKSAKAKELLAFLIYRQGGTVTTDQIISKLWEDRPNDEAAQNLCSKLVKKLQWELKQAGIEEMLVMERGVRCVDTDCFQCDLYDFMDGRKRAQREYVGEFLSDYSWAEDRVAVLDQILQNQI